MKVVELEIWGNVLKEKTEILGNSSHKGVSSASSGTAKILYSYNLSGSNASNTPICAPWSLGKMESALPLMCVSSASR